MHKINKTSKTAVNNSKTFLKKRFRVSRENGKVFQVGVKSLLYSSKEGFLLMRRNAKKYPRKRDLWDVPGGRIVLGKSLIANLQREIREETGISRETDTMLLKAQDIFWTNYEGQEVHIVRNTYISRVTDTRIKLSNEHTDHKWVTLPELLRTKGLDKYLRLALKDKHVLSFIKDYIDRQ